MSFDIFSLSIVCQRKRVSSTSYPDLKVLRLFSNSELSYLTHTDRTFFLLQEYGIKYNENEYFGIKLTDGMYDEDNVKYFKVFDPKNYLKSKLYL